MHPSRALNFSYIFSQKLEPGLIGGINPAARRGDANFKVEPFKDLTFEIRCAGDRVWAFQSLAAFR
jgi:hypothetical protein